MFYKPARAGGSVLISGSINKFSHFREQFDDIL